MGLEKRERSKMQRIPVGTKVRIGSGHFGYVQDHSLSSGAVEVAFFYPDNRMNMIHVLFIADWDVFPVTPPKEE